MSIDVLKNKIRKLRNPTALTLAPAPELVPPQILGDHEEQVSAMGDYCMKVLEALKGQLPAVKVSFGAFDLWGPGG